MKIIGVTHICQTIFDHHEVFPSIEIVDLLNNLPKGKRIGIEISEKTNKFKEIMSKYKREGLCEIGGEYFEYIERICKKNNIEIIYLEDEELHIEKINKELNYKKTKNFKDWMDINKNFIVDRHKYQEKKIFETSPDISFVGLAHANRFYFDKKFDAEYECELTLPRGGYAINDKEQIFSKKMLEGFLSLEKCINLYYNKQFSDKKPNYVGTWIQYNDERLIGYFELFIDEKNKGTISDFFGEAEFIGNIDEQNVDFVKTYFSGVKAAAKTPLHYVGEKINNDYQGNFSSKNISGTFVFGKESNPNLFSDREFGITLEEIFAFSTDYELIEERTRYLYSKLIK